jgi:mono/diheme cytochrome c family protein
MLFAGVSMADTPASRFTLRDLPLPAKLVVTCFLLAVALGYTAALAQLHFQDSKSGAPMPTVDDVVRKFTGRTRATAEAKPPVSTFVRLITAPEDATFGGMGTMVPAFTTQCPDFTKVSRGGGPALAHLRAERMGERDALVLWAGAPPEERAKAYADNHFGIPADQMPKSITKEFRSAADAVKVKSIIDARCARCHRANDAAADAGGATKFPLDTYAGVEKYLQVLPVDTVGGWTKTEQPMSLTKLTQSTHAHLLSFAVLFSLTGLVFAFTSYPTSVRCIVGPWALVAIITDVVFWWLARMSDQYGVYFAMAVIGTGGLAGLGLGTQIVLGLWNMYGPKGKLAILVVFALGGAAAGFVFKQVVLPGLDEKKRLAEQPKTPDAGTKPPLVTPVTKLSRLEQVLQFPVKDAAGKDLAVLDMPFKVEPDWNMVRAFFDADADEFADAKKKKDKDTMAELMPERHGELQAVLAWRKLPDADRRKTFEANAVELPPDLAKQVTSKYVAKASNRIKIESIITDRCVRCHGGDVDPKNRFANYDTLKQFLDPPK